MADKLFLNSVQLEGDRLLLGFAVGAPLMLSEAQRIRELPGGLAEYSVSVAGGDDRLEVRAVADAQGAVEKVIASAGPIPDDWHDNPGAPT